jgi:hemerythrin superfamily protein
MDGKAPLYRNLKQVDAKERFMAAGLEIINSALSQTRTSSEPTSADALTLLKADHRIVEELFVEFESAQKPRRKEAIMQKICMELTLHALLEESSFYPVVRGELHDEEELLNEVVDEHASLKWLISQLEAEDSDSELYQAKVMALKEYVQYHVQEEEREMFPRIRDSGLDIQELGQVLQTHKQMLQAEFSRRQPSLRVR